MLNMGPKTQRAVHDLRVIVDPEVSLKSAGDNIQRMLGRRGFENLNRCMVSIPVACKNGIFEVGPRSSMDVDVALKNISLNEMLRDLSPASSEGITEILSRVGRWWFTRCYEKGFLANGYLTRSNKSDREKKFFVTYAETPNLWRRVTDTESVEESHRHRICGGESQTPNLWRRVTVSCDYRTVEPDSFEMDLKKLQSERDKSGRIYESIEESLSEIQFYPTVTNLKLQTSEGRLESDKRSKGLIFIDDEASVLF